MVDETCAHIRKFCGEESYPMFHENLVLAIRYYNLDLRVRVQYKEGVAYREKKNMQIQHVDSHVLMNYNYSVRTYIDQNKGCLCCVVSGGALSLWCFHGSTDRPVPAPDVCPKASPGGTPD